MYRQITVIGTALLLVRVRATADIDPATYLDTILKYYEEKIHTDAQRRTSSQVEASIIPRPEGFENAKNWTTDAVMKILYLIKDTEAATTLKKAMRQMLDPSVATESNPEVKFRGDADPSLKDNVLQLRDTLRAEVLGKEISLDLFLDLLLPDEIAEWLESVASEQHLDEHVGNVIARMQKGGSGSPGQVGRPYSSWGDRGSSPGQSGRPSGFWGS